MLLRPAKLAIHRHCTISTLPATPLRPAQAHTISTLPEPCLRPAQACTISALPGVPLRPARPAIHRHSQYPLGSAPHIHTALHDLYWAVPQRPARPAIHRHSWSLPGLHPKACLAGDSQAFMISTWIVPLKYAKPEILRYAWSPLHQTALFRHTRPTLQRPVRLLQWQASARRSMGPTHLPLATGVLQICLETQTGLDAKGVTAKILRWKFHCSWTGDFFFLFFSFCIIFKNF
jgi:hypothetical protein